MKDGRKPLYAIVLLAGLPLIGVALAVLQVARARVPEDVQLIRRGAQLAGESEPGWTRDFTQAYLEGEQFTDADVELLLRFPTLELVSLKGSSVTDAGLELLGELPRLMRLDLSGTNVTAAGLAQLLQCHKLWELKLLECPHVGLTDLKVFAKAQRLHSITIEPEPLDPPVVLDLIETLGHRFPFAAAALFEAPAWLTLRHSYGRDRRNIEVQMDPGAALSALHGSMMELERRLEALPFRRLVSDFEIRGVWPNDHHGRLAFLPRLFPQVIAFYQPAVTDADLEVLSHCRELTALWTDTYRLQAYSRVTDDGLQQLASLSQLEQLSLASQSITGPGLEAIGRMKSLRSLTLIAPQADPAYVASWNRLAALESLELEVAAVVGTQLSPLSQLKQLNRIDLRQTDISRADLTWIEDELQMQRDGHARIPVWYYRPD